MSAYSGSFSGSFSGSYIGNGSQLTNIDYYTLQNLPQTISNFNVNSIIANSAFRDNVNINVKNRLNAETVISSSAQISASAAAAGFGTAGAVLNGLWSNIAEKPAGLMSSSAQTISNLIDTDLVVKSITAEQYVISSSVTYMTTSFSSGSTIFGDDILDTHQFTGSLYVSGSITATNITASGNISSSGIVYGTTGSFSHLQGNSPITVGDSITFQQPITASSLTSNNTSIFLGFDENNLNNNYIYIEDGGDLFILGSGGGVEIGSGDGYQINVKDTMEFATPSQTSLTLNDLYAVFQVPITTTGGLSSSGLFVNGLQNFIGDATENESTLFTQLAVGGTQGANIKLYSQHGASTRDVGLHMSASSNGQEYSIGLARARNTFYISPSDVSVGPESSVFEIDTVGNITASGDISSSGTITANAFVGGGSGITGVVSASYALTASYAENAGGGAGFPFEGDAVITGSLLINAFSTTSQSLSVIGSGSTVFDVIGSVGTLFSVDDDLTGTLFTVNDISGFPVLEASASGDVYIGKSPQSLYTTAIVSSTTAATTHSLSSLSTSSYDGAFFEYTAQSASNARAGNIMSTWNGSDIVYAETTTLDIGNTTDLTTEVIISQSQAQFIVYGANAGYKVKTIIKAI
jgi:hypothetical protein